MEIVEFILLKRSHFIDKLVHLIMISKRRLERLIKKKFLVFSVFLFVSVDYLLWFVDIIFV